MPQIVPTEYSKGSENYQCQKVVGHALCYLQSEVQSVYTSTLFCSVLNFCPHSILLLAYDVYVCV